jgi:hypothetical protein
VADWRDLSIREIEDLLEEGRQQALRDERSAVAGSKTKGTADERYQQYSSYLLSLRRLLMFLAENEPKTSRTRYRKERCPWCAKRVSVTEDTVWTCPADVRRDAPGWLTPAHSEIVDLRRKGSNPSSCGRAYGLSCYQDVPAHGECHRRG